MIPLFALVGCATSEPVVAVTVRGTSLQIGSTVESTLITDDSDPWPRIVGELVASRTPSRPLFLDSVLPAQPPASVARIDTSADTSWPVLGKTVGAARDAGFETVSLSVDGATPVVMWTVRAYAERRDVPGPDNDVVITLIPDGTGFIVGGFVNFAGIRGDTAPTCGATFASAALVTACENSDDDAAHRRCLAQRRSADLSELRATISGFVRTFDSRGQRNWSLDCEADTFPAGWVATAVGGMEDAGILPQDVMASGPFHSHFEDECLDDEADLELAEARAWGFFRR